MAQVNQRLWKIPGQRTKRKAWGFTAQINGKQVRRYKAEWTQDDAEAELAEALVQIEPAKPKGPGITLAQAADRYLASKGRKRTIDEDPTLLTDLEQLIEPTTRGDPESPLRWTCKSLRRLATELTRQGHRTSHRMVAVLLRQRGYRLQANRKTIEGTRHRSGGRLRGRGPRRRRRHIG